MHGARHGRKHEISASDGDRWRRSQVPVAAPRKNYWKKKSCGCWALELLSLTGMAAILLVGEIKPESTLEWKRSTVRRALHSAFCISFTSNLNKRDSNRRLLLRLGAVLISRAWLSHLRRSAAVYQVHHVGIMWVWYQWQIIMFMTFEAAVSARPLR